MNFPFNTFLDAFPTLFSKTPFFLRVEARMHAVQNIYEHREAGEEPESEIGSLMQSTQQEYVEKDGYGRNPWHQWDSPELGLSGLRDHEMEHVQD